MRAVDDPLAGLRVLDLSRGFSGAMVTMLLADFGAEVIKVESPEGDLLRREAAFYMWQRGKKSVVLDLKRSHDLARARQLAGSVEVLVQDFRPGVAERMGLGYPDLSRADSGLIYASITGFGTKGPYAHLKGYDAVVAAKLGALSQTGSMAGRLGPGFAAVPYASFGAAQHALQGLLAALYVRERTGRGQLVEATLAQGLASPAESTGPGALLDYLSQSQPEKYDTFEVNPSKGRPLADFTFRLLVAMTRDGRWLQFSQSSPHLWVALVKALDLEKVCDDDPGFAGAPRIATYEDSVRFWEMMLDRVREKSLDEWEEHFRDHPNVGAELFRSPEEALDHPQMRHNGHVIELVDPRVGPTSQLGPAALLLDDHLPTPRPAPDLGAHTNEVLGELTSGGLARRPGGWADVPRHALEGLTVLELGMFYAAPFGATILADLGARVIKLEPTRGDDFRIIFDVPETGSVKTLQGKESVAVDLRTPEGKEIAYRVAKKSDVVLVAFRGGQAQRMGLDCETLRKHNPDLVYLNAPGYGVDGPHAMRPAYAPTIGAGAGAALYQLGSAVSPEESAASSMEEIKVLSRRLSSAASAPSNADGVAAQVVGTALLLGLVIRERTGVAHEMLTSMLNSMSHGISNAMIRYRGRPDRSEPDADLYGLNALYRLYPAAEGWVLLACPKDGEWHDLCRAVGDLDAGATDLAGDPRFASEGSRRQHDAALVDALSQLFKTRSASDWEDYFAPRDVACVEVASGPFSRSTYADPIMVENEFVTMVDHPIFGSYPRLTPLVRMSLTPGLSRPATVIGQHTEAVLTELGYSRSEIEDLEAREIIRCDREN